MQTSVTRHGHEVDREEMARRFRLLLEKFPRGDGEPWRPVEIEEATGHQVSGSYVVALKKGKFKRPGLKQLSLIADVVGFPFELWRTEPEFWDEELKKHKVRVRREIDTLSDEDRRLVEAAQHLTDRQRTAVLALAEHLGADEPAGS